MTLRLKRNLEFGINTFQIFKPKEDVVYPDSNWIIFGTVIFAERDFLSKYPADARLFINGKCEGKLIDVFNETMIEDVERLSL